jgi:citrate synthase
MSDRSANINFSDGSPSITFPMLTGTIDRGHRHPHAVRKTGKFTYDPGFLSTASCSSAITYIDGDKGELLYRGYPIEELSDAATFSRPATCCCTASCPRLIKKTSSCRS